MQLHTGMEKLNLHAEWDIMLYMEQALVPLKLTEKWQFQFSTVISTIMFMKVMNGMITGKIPVIE